MFLFIIKINFFKQNLLNLSDLSNLSGLLNFNNNLTSITFWIKAF